MPYFDRYPKTDAHGRPIDRVPLVQTLTGLEEFGLDDGFDVVDGESTLHVQASLLRGRLDKRCKHPDTGELVPAFVVKPGFKFRPSTAGGRHPLSRYESSASGVDVEAISESHNKKRKAEAEVAKVRAEEMAKPFVDAKRAKDKEASR